MATPGTFNIQYTRGDTFSQSMIVKDSTGAAVNLTGWTVTSQIRVTEDDVNPVVSFTVTNGGSTGLITLALTAAQTASLPLTSGGLYDVQLVDPSGNVSTYVGGTVTMKKDVTR